MCALQFHAVLHLLHHDGTPKVAAPKRVFDAQSKVRGLDSIMLDPARPRGDVELTVTCGGLHSGALGFEPN